MWVLEASVAREIEAEGLGKWRGMAEEREDFFFFFLTFYCLRRGL
jgi:hypothetical protein